MTVLPEQSGRQNSAYRSGCHKHLIFINLLSRARPSVHDSGHFFEEWSGGTSPHPAAGQDIQGWTNVAHKRNTKKRIQWPSGGRFLIEGRENGKRLRASAGETPAEALTCLV
jgi:hypothetical protein